MPRMKKQQFKVGDRVKIIKEYQGCYVGECGSIDILDENNETAHVRMSDGKLLKMEYTKDYDVIELFKKTLNDLEVGDVVLDDDDDEYTVLAVCGKLIALSECNSPEEFEGSWYTSEELEEDKYTIKGVETEVEPVKMTVEEIEKKLGVTNLHVVGEDE